MQVSHGTHHHQDACLHLSCANPDLTQPQPYRSLPAPLGCPEAPSASCLLLPEVWFSSSTSWDRAARALSPHVSGLESGQVCSQPLWSWPRPSCLVTGLLCPRWAHVSLAHCVSLHPDTVTISWDLNIHMGNSNNPVTSEGLNNLTSGGPEVSIYSSRWQHINNGHVWKGLIYLQNYDTYS